VGYRYTCSTTAVTKAPLDGPAPWTLVRRDRNANTSAGKLAPHGGAIIPNSNAGASLRKIFVGGLHLETDERKTRRFVCLTSGKKELRVFAFHGSTDALHHYFSRYGTVVSTEIMMNRSTSKSRGFGFVTFAAAASIENVLGESRKQQFKSISHMRARTNKHLLPAFPRCVLAQHMAITTMSTGDELRSRSPCRSCNEGAL
jgi:hypothetical protein